MPKRKTIMQVITLLNEKGGVGKTTSAVHIAAGLAIQGKKVLLIDSDPQGHSTARLGQKEYGGLYRLLVQEAEWKAVLFEVPQTKWAGSYPVQGVGQLVVLPSNIETRLIPMAVDDITLLRERLADLGDYFDIAVVDTSPTPSLLHTMIYVATDMMVYPTQCQALAMDGLGKSIFHIKKMNDQRAALGLESAVMGGVLPTMFDGRTEAHRQGLDNLKKHFGENVLPTLRELTAWREAEFKRQTLFAYARGSAAETDMWRVIDALKIS
jgi:chromosome partitioning protein